MPRKLIGHLMFGVLLVGAAPLKAHAEPLLDERFDGPSVSTNLSDRWEVRAPDGTSVGIASGFSVSGTRCLRFGKMTASGGAYPQAIVNFRAVTGGVVRVSYTATADTSNHDALYVKLRDANGRELGGVRYSPSSTLQYQMPDGTWRDAGIAYAAGKWNRFRIEFDLDRNSYSAWADGSMLAENTPFRTSSRTAASLILQDRVVAGSGFSFLDDLKIELLPPRASASDR